MINPDQVITMIKTGLPDAEVQINDLTGGGDHFEATVVSANFEGLTLVKQHQLVYKTVQEAMSTNDIHALALKTYTPEKWSALQS
ncbi:MAG: BolA family protein [Leptolyngbyaceae cyanobacterium]